MPNRGIVFALLLVGCQVPKNAAPVHPTMSFYNAPDLYPQRPLRVYTVPMVCRSGHRDAAQSLLKHVGLQLDGTHLVRISGALSVPPDCPMSDSEDRLQLLANARKQYGADAILFSELDDYHPYWPPRISLTTEVVSTRTGEVLLRASGNWDARHRQVVEEFDQFASRTTVAQAYRSSNLAMQSPEHFQKFVAHQVAESVLANRPRALHGVALTSAQQPTERATGSDAMLKTEPSGSIPLRNDVDPPPVPYWSSTSLPTMLAPVSLSDDSCCSPGASW